MKIIYMGTPDFAVPALKALANSEHEVCAVFTQPDKPRGRKMVMTPPDVKVCAEKLSIPVYQPETFKDGKPLELSINIILMSLLLRLTEKFFQSRFLTLQSTAASIFTARFCLNTEVHLLFSRAY